MSASSRWTSFLLLIAILYYIADEVRPQINNQNTPDNFVFYLDSSADCNGPTRNIFDSRSTINGQGSPQSGAGPTTCKIGLRTEKPYEVSIFKVEVRALQIQDCGVIFTIYDGDDGYNRLGSYDCDQGKEPGMQPFTTSGDRVTFVLQRQDIRNTRFDISILVTPIVAGRDPDTGTGDGGDYGYNYHRKFPTEAIVGIVGGLFVVIIIVIGILTIYCYRRHRGLNKRWEQQPLSYLNTNSNFDAASNVSKSNYSDNDSVWSSEVSKKQSYPQPYRHKSRSRHNDYEESVIDDAKRSYSKAGSTRSGRTDRSRDAQPPGYFTATRNSYVGADDHHSQDNFTERVVPVRSKSRSNEEPKRTTSVGNDPVYDDEDDMGDAEEIESEPEVQESEEEQEEEEESEEEEEATRPAPTKPTRKGPGVPTTQPMNQAPIQPQPFHPIPGQRSHSQRQMMHPQYLPYPPPQQQFIPVQTVPYGLQQMPPGYPPPVYPGQAQPQPQTEPVRVPSVKPTDPPIYSYLVQRGYTPLDGRQSPASMSSAASNHSAARLLKEDSDSGNLQSGVEFMRR